jgi:hypothetical protein
MSAKTTAVIVGGEPRIDFLPPEIRQKKKSRGTVRALVGLVVAVLAVCIAAYVGTTTLAIASQVNLDRERDRTQQLLNQQNEFAEARSVSSTLEAAKDARLVASAQEVLWAPYLTALVATLPVDSSIVVASVDTVSATEEKPEYVEGIELPRKGSITLTGNFASTSAIAAWFDSLDVLPGFAGYSVNPAVLEDTGRYSIQITLQIDEGANGMRFFEAVAEDDTEAATDSAGEVQP